MNIKFVQHIYYITVLEKYQDFMTMSKDYDEASELLLTLPQENDIPNYVITA